MKDVQCYELFGGIALKNHAFSFHFSFSNCVNNGRIWMVTQSDKQILNTDI